MTRYVAHAVQRATSAQGDLAAAAGDHVTLDYEGRFLRRKTLTTANGAALFVDLPETVSLNHGDAFVTSEGRRIAVHAASEPLIQIVAPAPELTRLAWHIGNRHMPAQIESGRILIQANHVIQDMLTRLGAATQQVSEPFTPEGGAYGSGRTHGHHHGAAPGDAHDHPASPA